MNLKFKLFISLLLLFLAGAAWWGAGETLPAPSARAADDYEEMMARLHPLDVPKADIVRCSNPSAKFRCKNGVCTTSTDPQACFFYGGVEGPVIFTATVTATVAITPETPAADVTPVPGATPTPAAPTPTPTPFIPGADNLIYNGNFEYGFYQVPQLGFEPPDVGNVPNDWGWYKNPAYGKYTINSNQSLGLRCRDDLTPEAISLARQRQLEEDEGFGPIPGAVSLPPPNNSASFQIQSSDQVDARLGIYQVVNVVPGQTYRLTMSGTIQVQEGATTLQPPDPEAPQEAPNHTVELFFDHRGGTDWKAIPQEEKIIIQWPENEVLFEDDDEDEDETTETAQAEDDDDDDEEVELSNIEEFETLVTARSNRLTVFIGAWRKWANWRSGYINIDCVSLVPVSRGGIPLTGAGGGQPAAAGQAGQPGLPTTGENQTPNYIITGQGLMESPRFGRTVR